MLRYQKGGAEGVLFSMEDDEVTLFIKDNKLQYGYNYVTSEYFYVKSVEDVPEGRHKFRFEFEVKGKPDFGTWERNSGISAALY
ncbi:MAG: hypothetical protein R2942_06175 [Ignavibacteria bacterium]